MECNGYFLLPLLAGILTMCLIFCLVYVSSTSILLKDSIARTDGSIFLHAVDNTKSSKLTHAHLPEHNAQLPDQYRYLIMLDYGRWLEEHHLLMSGLPAAGQDHLLDNKLQLYVDHWLSIFHEDVNVIAKDMNISLGGLKEIFVGLQMLDFYAYVSNVIMQIRKVVEVLKVHEKVILEWEVPG
ncbi:hypothetical protein POM88_027406 [Heracleum sosnowskyi]|uniref:Uncharacterized protein n=1 Tax=Heracleum sosnowskyi TaxID=360622 RepID=A0AAD8I7K0_9APIA|nr:hypothetical protein POM88_027406 [Heracleum sosnowskyi]